MNRKMRGEIEERALPIDRRQVFFRSFHDDFATILLVSLFMTLFALPAIAVIMIAFLEIGGIAQEEMTAETISAMYGVRRWMYFWLIPALALFGVGGSGGAYVMRNLVWSEPSPFFRDFGKGIRQGAVQSLTVTLFFALFLAALCLLADFLTLNFDVGWFYSAILVLQAVLILFALSLLLVQYCIIAVYKDSLLHIVKNSFVLVFGSLPTTFLTVLLAVFPLLFFLLFSDVFWVYLIIVTVMALVGFGYMMLLMTLHCHRLFDKHINIAAFPDLYRKGLYKEEKPKTT